MPAPMVNDILNNALFHSSPHIFHVLHFCTLDSLVNYDPDFIVNWIKIRAVQQPQAWKFIGVAMISEIIALSEQRQRMLHKLFG